MTRQGEFDWIARYLAPLAGEGSFGLKDDAALLKAPPGLDIVVTQDAILEGVHFLPTDPADRIARKALRVNLSDIIAKGARPFAYSLALGVPDRWHDDDMAGFASGLEHDQKQFGLSLTGGDTYRSPERLCVSITMFGAVNIEGYRSRLGAKADDLMVVSGTIGAGALGLKVATGQIKVEDHLVQEMLDGYQLPNPPFALSGLISNNASASMDISDGLLGDCRKLCEVSGVSARISARDVPLSPVIARLVAESPQLWADVLTGGDDYQCLCTVSPDRWQAFLDGARQVGVDLTVIGRVTTAEPGKVVLDKMGLDVSIDDDSYSHF